jgi:hypothetical protein
VRWVSRIVGPSVCADVLLEAWALGRLAGALVALDGLVVAGLADALVVAWVEEEMLVSLMRDAVVDDGCLDGEAGGVAPFAEWMR